MKNKEIRIDRNLSFFFVSFIFFAQSITFGVFESDTSPFYLCALVFLIKKISLKSLIALLIATIALVFFAATNNNFLIIKLLAALFLGFILINVALNYTFKNTHLLMCSVISFMLGVITLFDAEIFSFLLYRVGSGGGRGAVGLLAESSLYGLSSSFLTAILLEKYYIKRSNKLLLAILFSSLSVLISISLFAYLMYLVILLFYFNKMSRFSLLLIISFLTSLLAGFIVAYYDFFAQLRIFTLGLNILTEPSLLLSDISILYRISFVTDIFNSLSFNFQAKESMTAGYSLLLYEFNYFGIVIILLLTSAYSHYLLPIKRFSLHVIFVVVFFIGPLSIPLFWIWSGMLIKKRV